MESKHRSYIVQRLKRHQTQFTKQELKLANALITLELTCQNFTDLIKIVNPHFREEYQKAKNQFNQLSKNDKYLNGAGFDFIFMEKGDQKFEKVHQMSEGRAIGVTKTSLNPNQKVKYVQTLLKMQQIKSQSYQMCLLKLFSIIRIYEQISTTKSAERAMMKSERSKGSIIQQKMEKQFQNDSFSKDSANQLSTKSNLNIQKAQILNMVKKNQIQNVQNSFQLQRKLEETKESYEKYIKQLQQQIIDLKNKLKLGQQSFKKIDQQRKNLQIKKQQNDIINRQKVKVLQVLVSDYKHKILNFEKKIAQESKNHKLQIQDLSKKLQLLNQNLQQISEHLSRIKQQNKTLEKDKKELQQLLVVKDQEINRLKQQLKQLIDFPDVMISYISNLDPAQK